ncbi:MAG: hypothetical protein ACR2M4_01800 [Actinomycetota bacterium]
MNKQSGPLWAVIIVISLIAFLVFAAWIYMSGGFSGWISNLKSSPSPSELRDESRAAMARLAKDLKRIESNGLVFFDEARHDYCYEGLNDFKVQSDYSNRCDVRITRYYGFNGEFRPTIQKLESHIGKLGWSAESLLDRTLALYFDRYVEAGKPRLVSDLPTRRFSKKDLLLDMEYGQKETKFLTELRYAQNVKGASLHETFEKKKSVDADSLFLEILKDYEFVLAISVQARYFDN